MALITLPAGARFKTVRWGLVQPSQVNRSGWSGARRVVKLGAPVWRVEASIIPITREAQARPWRAFFAALEGRANTFRMPAYNIVAVGANPAAGAVAAGTGSAGSSKIATVGGGAAPAGSYATLPLVGGLAQLVVLTQDYVPGGTLHFKPALRAAVVPGQAVVFNYPFAEVALTEDEVSWEGSEGQQFAFSLTAEEAY